MKTGLIIGAHTGLYPPDLPEAERPVWLIDRCAALGLDVAHLPPVSGGAKAIRRVRAHAAERGVELEVSGGMDYVTEGAERAAGLAEVVGAIEHARALGCSVLRTANAHLRHNRWGPPPVARQLELFAASLRELVPAAEENGVVVAVENHLDYRGDEIAAVLEMVDSSWVRAAPDTGNGYAVFAEPLDDVRALAPYAVTTHVKDVRIVPSGGDVRQLPWRPVGCALGQGHVDLCEAARILAKRAPDPASLRLIVEISWPPGGWTHELYEESARFLKTRLAEYLN